MPDLDAAIHQPFQDDGVLVYGVYGGEDPAAVADFQAQTGVTFPLLQDTGSLNQLAFPAGVGYPYPRDVIIGKDGTVRAIRNSFNAEEVELMVEELLLEAWP